MNAIRILLTLAVLALTSGCASNRANNPADPLESLNRGIYQFNDAVDKAIAKPVAQGYDAVMPAIGKTAVSNFFSNLDDIIVTANDFLQFKFLQGVLDGTRFVVNTTVGLYGLVDVGYDKHYRVNHSKDEFSDGHGHHVNGIEAFWSYAKRRITMFNGVRKTHFERFLKECEWRYNRSNDTLEKELKQLLATHNKKQRKGRI